MNFWPQELFKSFYGGKPFFNLKKKLILFKISEYSSFNFNPSFPSLLLFFTFSLLSPYPNDALVNIINQREDEVFLYYIFPRFLFLTILKSSDDDAA
jgi:hypothetical protein